MLEFTLTNDGQTATTATAEGEVSGNQLTITFTDDSEPKEIKDGTVVKFTIKEQEYLFKFNGTDAWTLITE